ncbi:uncharacterized protein K489DRAFT_383665 [Dissoconium aciculare CBS 342.82]|uniref:DEAD-box RNA helicase Q domain-containing protein n=1 Tax=Dissoconium aciculare CBS 342.82 TaxID=1314786 RepID=A0A6J3LW03_9PEZI|nr:uncharacterized protein K489DRAFT_383665 [Dissoconium aciculare CBS 342.82]KAF1819444.1 hypothetical protein K489DRAFT_383665 [Dissoconium aciculare CBS 342.82]
MNLKSELLRGIYAYGFERPSAIQQRAIMPVIKGKLPLFSAAGFEWITAMLTTVQATMSSLRPSLVPARPLPSPSPPFRRSTPT